MATWLTIALGVLCLFWALMQLRMVFVYTGRAQSATVGPLVGPQPTLTHVAVRSAITFFALALVFFLVSWPKLLLVIAGVLLARAVIDLVLFSFSIGMFRLYAPNGSFANARSSLLAKQIGNIVFFGLAAAIVFYFLGGR